MQSRRSTGAPYTRLIDVLVLCTANQCRSPMAEVLLRDRFTAAGVEAQVSSAGELPGGAHASPGSVRAMGSRGLDLAGHVSRQVTPELLRRADLVLAMGRRHVRNAVAIDRDSFAHTFTVKELARRGASVGARRAGQSLQDWLADVHRGRSASELLGDDPRDDVADPIGGPDRLYEVAATEIADLIDRIVDLGFRDHAGPSTADALARPATPTRESA